MATQHKSAENGTAKSSASLSESITSTTNASSLPPPLEQDSPSASHKAADAPTDGALSDDSVDIQAHIERKRLEHEQQRATQRKAFEQQMALLEQQQREEEQNLLEQRQQSATSSDTPDMDASTTPSSQAGNDSLAAGALGGQDAGGELSATMKTMTLETQQPSTAKTTDDDDKPDSAHQGDGFTPAFNERFLFDDELDNEDSAFVKKYNLNRDDDKFPILVQRDSFSDVLSAQTAAPASEAIESKSPARTRPWPQLGATTSDAALAAAAAAANRKPDLAGDGTSSLLAVANKTSPPHSVSGSSTPFTAAARSGTLPLPSPSPRLPQSTGHSSPAHNEAVRTGAAGSRFVPTGLQQQQTPSHKNVGVPASHREPAFPSFNLGAFKAGSAGAETSNQFTSYSPSKFDDADAARGNRSASGLFDAFNPTAGANTPGSVYPADKYSMGMVAPGLAAKPARKAELDMATRLEDLQGEIFALCKDQHGCRFLQKKLEEGTLAHRDMIFAETFPHFAELMTDPFGNYLCQKMLEYCTDEQRNLIVESVASELVTISLNMHGTRAVQKMIDFLSTSRQIHSIIVALSMNVVTLIKDLNGNHVIQKCLNRLGAEDNQFIYNAVAAHCVEVATHRHGCCVLQRCIDHASETQRVQLVAEITYNALSLVQDAFGNYVVQYVLDLNVARFTDSVVRQFVGNVCLLSVQKFSSNVMEKCIRVSEPGVRKQLVEELLNRTRLEKLLRDSFANYVVQTSLDYADPVQRMRLVECIRPILPVIRNTPYGKRIQSKLQRDNLDFGPPPPGQGVPYSVLQAAHQQQQMQAMGMGVTGPGGGGGGGGGGQHQYHQRQEFIPGFRPQRPQGQPMPMFQDVARGPHARPPMGPISHNLPRPNFGPSNPASFGYPINMPSSQFTGNRNHY